MFYSDWSSLANVVLKLDQFSECRDPEPLCFRKITDVRCHKNRSSAVLLCRRGRVWHGLRMRSHRTWSVGLYVAGRWFISV